MKTGKNEFCFCGSGLKYKKCCMLKEQEVQVENNDTDDIDDIDDTDDTLDALEMLTRIRTNFQDYLLKNKSHIKEYKKLRKLHGDIIDKMVLYFEDGKFKQQVDADYASNLISPHKKQNNKLILFESNFDLNTDEGSQGFFDILIYKTAPNVNCITEEFIKNNRYKKLEKINLLQSMLDSKLGLFEVIEVDSKEGYVYIKEVFTSMEYKLIDIALSSNKDTKSFYLYTRIITHCNISFNSGLNFAFNKKDSFIKNFININRKDYTPIGEFKRFAELYNYFSNNSKGIKVITNTY